MVLRKFPLEFIAFLLLAILHIAQAGISCSKPILVLDIISATGVMWPTGGSDIASRELSMTITITVLENYTDVEPICTEFIFAYTLIVVAKVEFDQSGYFGLPEVGQAHGVANINGKDSTQPIYALDDDLGSVAQYSGSIPFVQGTVLKLTLTNMKYVIKDYKNMEVSVILITSNRDSILMKRIQMPFHADAVVGSNTDQTIVNVKFASASGYLKSGSFSLLE